MEPITVQPIPQVRTMPQAPTPAPHTYTKNIVVIIFALFVLLDVALSVYWIRFRKIPITEQDKLSILEKLSQSSKAQFTPEEKTAVLDDLASQSQSSGSAANMNADQKSAILDALGTQQ